MQNLTQLREKIDTIDKKLVFLLGERLRVVAKIGETKMKDGKNILDLERETAVIKRIKELSPEALSPQIIAIFETIIAVSRQYQTGE